MKIDSFRGEHYFLSNFYESPVTYDGLVYKNNEAAFQSAKLVKETSCRVNNRIITRESFTMLTPNKAKQLGRNISLREDWEKIKVSVMVEIVMNKFANPELKKKLLSTGQAELVEGNTWHDTTWGRCNGVGKNYLGKILMEVRKYYNKKEDN